MKALHSIAAAIPLVLLLWTLGSLTTTLAIGLVLRRRARKRKVDLAMNLIRLKNAQARAQIQLLKRAP